MLLNQQWLCQTPNAAQVALVAPSRMLEARSQLNQSKRKTFQVQAQQKERQQAQDVESPETDAEASRIAELESRKRGRKSKGKQSLQTSTPPAAQSSGGFANWPEGQLLPDGWPEMNPIQKAGELWSGRRGVLFWANKAAWASVFIIGGVWILFRIVGPLTGLYTLKNDLLSPPNQ